MSFFSNPLRFFFGLSLLLFAFCPNVLAQTQKRILEPYRLVLKNYVNEQGLVDYQGLKERREKLTQAVEALGNLDSKSFNTWSKPDKIAFYLNTYNLLTLQTIVDHYPIGAGRLWGGGKPGGIKDIPGAWNSITHLVLGEKMTLDHIEHDILRKQFKEPRIHFALVCASLGCPYLRQEPYEGKKLEIQLAGQVRKFLSTPTKFQIDTAHGKVFLSPLFKWFGDDFKAAYGPLSPFRGYSDMNKAVLNFISLSIGEKGRGILLAKYFQVEYLDYDWSLNDQGFPR